MTIKLDFAKDQTVFVQFKHGVYVVASHQGHFVPLSAGPSQEAAPPLVVDKLEGVVREKDGQFFLTYQNPANPDQAIEMTLEPENVACVWILRRIQVVSPQLITPGQ